jgi:hypothetical protein
MKKNRYPQAFQSFLKLRMHPIIAARDLYYSHVLYQEELKLARGMTYFTRLTDLFTVPRIRHATWASGMVMIAQQMCGINSAFCPPRGWESAVLTCTPSHRLLLVHHLRRRRLQPAPGAVRVSRVRRAELVSAVVSAPGPQR